MKHLKQKLIASVLMLTVAAAMLTTSTFAWFAISTAPEVEGVTTEITATGAFEIALGTDSTTKPEDTELGDAGKDTAWGAAVGTVTGATGINFPMTIDTANNKAQVPSYDESGRPNTSLSDATLTFDYDTADNGTSQVITSITVGDGSESKVVGSSTLVWLRTNQDVTDAKVTVDTSNITLTTGEGVTTTLVTSDVGVAIKVGSAYYETGSTLPKFTANEATAVEIIVYLKDTVTNEDLGSNVTISVGEIAFTSETILPTTS